MCHTWKGRRRRGRNGGNVFFRGTNLNFGILYIWDLAAGKVDGAQCARSGLFDDEGELGMSLSLTFGSLAKACEGLQDDLNHHLDVPVAVKDLAYILLISFEVASQQLCAAQYVFEGFKRLVCLHCAALLAHKAREALSSMRRIGTSCFPPSEFHPAADMSPARTISDLLTAPRNGVL